MCNGSSASSDASLKTAENLIPITKQCLKLTFVGDLAKKTGCGLAVLPKCML
jgi:hypothetical protein